MQKLNWTHAALADLRKIDAFLTREASPEITVRMLKSIRARANVLVDFPHAGPIVEDRSFRSLKVQNTPFLIAYRVGPNSLEILRIFHERENWRDAVQ